MKQVKSEIEFPKMESEILAFWREQNIFQRSMSPDLPGADGQKKKRPEYVFYDGPPFATGLPHYGHLLAGTIKDVVGRYFTMRGYHVDRRFGWDCHGVPVEFEIQKALGLHGSKAIREFGVGKFNEECRKIVLRYTQEWRQFVERSGRWVDFEREYRTMDLPFMESIWWVLQTLWDRGMIYEGLKCVPFSWAINTPLSNFEANLNYKVVQDPAITIRMALKSSLVEHFKARSIKAAIPAVPAYAIIWTTTPWTLPANMAIAAGPELDYSIIFDATRQELYIVAAGRIAEYFPALAATTDAGEKNEDRAEAQEIVASVKGSDLVGLEYIPCFPYFEAERAKKAFRIYPGAFVTADDGTGLVHCASFGEDDVALFLENGITVTDPVSEDGLFTAPVTDFEGMQVHAANPKIISALKKTGALIQHKTIEHSYPFCYRTDTPLIYKSISSWFVKVEAIRSALLESNSAVRWVPEHVKDGRFGKWLEGARDWAISRNRFWGTPIPIWRCGGCGEKQCIGSVAELSKLSGQQITDLHSHFVDKLTIPCPKCGGKASRIPQVLDCWFESGSMPYAQAHYPFENKEAFEKSFPADFIAEGLDQTRGWFYTLMVLSTHLFGRSAFKNVVVNGIVLAEDGKKMSKSLKNYPDPNKVMDEIGADAMRLYLLSSAATRGDELRFSEEGVRNIVRQTLLPLWNAYNFFVTYAQVDEWVPDQATAAAAAKSPNLLDRWILSKLNSLILRVSTALDSYQLYGALQPILDFVDQLTNWYIRLNRRRFWGGNRPGEREDKFAAYATLHTTLVAFVRVLAPLAPFISEEIYQNLGRDLAGSGRDSVHLTPFPAVAEFAGETVDSQLEQAMELFEEVILLGRSLRNDHELKVRQPLAKLTVIHPNAELLQSLSRLDSYIRDELNVKQVEYTTEENRFVALSARLNTKLHGRTLGPKLGSDGMRELQKKIASLTTEEINGLESGETFTFQELPFGAADLLIERKVQAGVDACASSGKITAVLDTNLTQELRLEGLAREFINRLQKLRKDSGFEVTDRIIVHYMTACPKISLAIQEHRDAVMQETLTIDLKEVTSESEINFQGSSTHLPVAHEIGDKVVIISATRVQA